MIRISKETVCNSLNIVLPHYSFNNEFATELFDSLKRICLSHIEQRSNGNVQEAILYTQQNMVIEPGSWNEAYFFSPELIIESGLIDRIPEGYYKEVRFKSLTNNRDKSRFIQLLFLRLFRFYVGRHYNYNIRDFKELHDLLPQHLKESISPSNIEFIIRFHMVVRPFSKMKKKEREMVYFSDLHLPEIADDFLNDVSNQEFDLLPGMYNQRNQDRKSTYHSIVRKFISCISADEVKYVYNQDLFLQENQ